MIKAKVTNKGQITIPIEIRRLLNVKAGDQISFSVNEYGIIIDKSTRPLTIQERFAHYNINKSEKELNDQMKEIDAGADVGEGIL